MIVQRRRPAQTLVRLDDCVPGELYLPPSSTGSPFAVRLCVEVGGRKHMIRVMSGIAVPRGPHSSGMHYVHVPDAKLVY